MVTIVKSSKGSDAAIMVACQSCVEKGRRGRSATFPASRAEDLMKYIKRHKKHKQ